MTREVGNTDCFGRRVEHAGHLVAHGQWASGHAIASSLLRCASAGGCPCQADCARQAQSVMGSIRALLAN
ncbi:hypothetical protein [Magnetospirillum sp. LM-5]|uniref:hypothetical protein n=1 Tax=Magnetospirillum sp. LM-5 TaxID=2681466 RepID=UPI00157091E5|nr:hypothetical protein [Magnetospirillum sp. LM-5]